MIYLDSCILISALEDDGHLGESARKALRTAEEGFAVSPAVVHEALVVPFRRADTELIERYEDIFRGFRLVELGLGTFIDAARIRADHPGVKAVDALHLAAARLAGCTALWTNDKRLATVSRGLAVDVVGEEPPTG